MNNSNSWTDYQEHLSRVQAWIHDYFDQPLGLAGVVGVADTAMPVEQTACKWGYPNVQRFAPSFGGVYATKSSRCRAEGRHILFNKGLAKAIAGSYTVELRQEPEIRLGKVNAQSRAFMAAQGLLQADTSWMAVQFQDPSGLHEANRNGTAVRA